MLTNEKAEKTLITNLMARIDKFEELEHQNYIKDILLPELEQFKNKAEFFYKQNEE